MESGFCFDIVSSRLVWLLTFTLALSCAVPVRAGIDVWAIGEGVASAR